MNFFVIELDENGEPAQLRGPGTFDECRQFAATIAREWGIVESKIEKELLNSETPGVYTEPIGVHDACGVFVVGAEPL